MGSPCPMVDMVLARRRRGVEIFPTTVNRELGTVNLPEKEHAESLIC